MEVEAAVYHRPTANGGPEGDLQGRFPCWFGWVQLHCQIEAKAEAAMVKLDASLLRYFGRDEFRVLSAVEMGMRNHDLVPQPLLEKIAGLRRSGEAHRALVEVHRAKLVWHSRAPGYEGYRLTASGYDYLALNAMCRAEKISAMGKKLGVGKEADVYLVQGPDPNAPPPAEGTINVPADLVSRSARSVTSRRTGSPKVNVIPMATMLLKLHRLGRTSFRAVKDKRDYLKGRKTGSWIYLSRLAAQKEFAFMTVLHNHGFPVPQPIMQNRHAILMELCKGTLLAHVTHCSNPGKLYNTIMELIVRLAAHGLIHCDCNEFNIIVDDDLSIKLIDFPQMISTSHPNAPTYFARDVECVRTFFTRKLYYTSERYPVWGRDVNPNCEVALDKEVSASGFTKNDQKALENLLEQEKDLMGTDYDGGQSSSDNDDSEDSDSEESDTDEEARRESAARGDSGEECGPKILTPERSLRLDKYLDSFEPILMNNDVLEELRSPITEETAHSEKPSTEPTSTSTPTPTPITTTPPVSTVPKPEEPQVAVQSSPEVTTAPSPSKPTDTIAITNQTPDTSASNTTTTSATTCTTPTHSAIAITAQQPSPSPPASTEEPQQTPEVTIDIKAVKKYARQKIKQHNRHNKANPSLRRNSPKKGSKVKEDAFWG
ncbi:atypical/RIO/RIO2 protein kinase [Pelomyxa schiedti]|nr:atypical/RIO/RIO2 protein kinase [Pelomyxa schiedti]